MKNLTTARGGKIAKIIQIKSNYIYYQKIKIKSNYIHLYVRFKVKLITILKKISKPTIAMQFEVFTNNDDWFNTERVNN